MPQSSCFPTGTDVLRPPAHPHGVLFRGGSGRVSAGLEDAACPLGSRDVPGAASGREVAGTMTASTPTQDQGSPLWSESAQVALAANQDAALTVDAVTWVILDADPRAEGLIRSSQGAFTGRFPSELPPPDLRASTLPADAERELDGSGVLVEITVCGPDSGALKIVAQANT